MRHLCYIIMINWQKKIWNNSSSNYWVAAHTTKGPYEENSVVMLWRKLNKKYQIIFRDLFFSTDSVSWFWYQMIGWCCPFNKNILFIEIFFDFNTTNHSTKGHVRVTHSYLIEAGMSWGKNISQFLRNIWCVWQWQCWQWWRPGTMLATWWDSQGLIFNTK